MRLWEVRKPLGRGINISEGAHLKRVEEPGKREDQMITEKVDEELDSQSANMHFLIGGMFGN